MASVCPSVILCSLTLNVWQSFGFSLTFRVQEFGEAQVLLSNVEGLLEVVCSIGTSQFVKFYQVGSAGYKLTKHVCAVCLSTHKSNAMSNPFG